MEKQKISLLGGLEIIVKALWELFELIIGLIAYVILKIYLLCLLVLSICLFIITVYIFWKTFAYIVQ